ncbi:MAG: transglycosylase SLT domain-containing protein [Deltaproteobacteria bacterium]|nr:transglycosylase SLT domain-containing protein [Deltaproteobacteria bacterium]
MQLLRNSKLMRNMAALTASAFFLFNVDALHAKPKESKDPESATRSLSRLVLSGQFRQALETLESVSGKKAKGLWKQRLQFMGAYLNLKAKNYAEAARLFQEIRKDYPLIQDYLDFYLAIALRESGKAQEAIKIFSDLSARVLPPRLYQGVSRELSLAYCKAGDRGTAIDRLNALIQNESSPAKTYRLRFDRAQCLLDLGDKSEAFPLLKSLYLNYPEGDLNDEILSALQKAEPAFRLSAVDHLERADALTRKNRPDLAVLDLEAASSMQGGASFALKEKLGEAYFKARRYREAASLLAAETSTDKRMDLAKAYARSDQFEEAIAVYRELESKPGTNQSDIAFKIAFLKMDQGKLEEANTLFEELLQRYPQHPKRDAVEWYLAWNHYQLGQYEDAAERFSRIQDKAASSKNGARSLYWQARSLDKQGKASAAKALYASIADGDVSSYYGFLAQKRLEAWGPPDLPPKKGAAQSVPHLDLPSPFSMSRLEGEGGKTAVLRLRELLMVGLWEDFLSELDFVAAREGVAEEFQQIQSAMNGGGSAPAVEDGEGRWGAKYPPAYATLVSLFSQIRQFPMALAWAIMREESHFRPQVVSAAQAIGLMQIIPPTGCEIAESLGRTGFSPEDLYRPVVNIEYGIQYLTMNLKRFNGNLVETIASYNAGPDAVARWHKARPQREWDEFVEEIPYAETQEYVRKVLKSYYLYSLLYAPPKS